MLFLLFLNKNLNEKKEKIASFTPNPLSIGGKPCSNSALTTPNSLNMKLFLLF